MEESAKCTVASEATILRTMATSTTRWPGVDPTIPTQAGLGEGASITFTDVFSVFFC